MVFADGGLAQLGRRKDDTAARPGSAEDRAFDVEAGDFVGVT